MKQIKSKLEKVLETVLLKIQDDSLKENALNAGGAGLEIRVTRTYDGIGVHNRKDRCQWCLQRCGKNMTLQEAYQKGSFQRHEGCGCIIEYVSWKGIKSYQTGKSSPTSWLSENEFKRRVEYGIDGRALTPMERIINAAIEMQFRDKKSLTLVNAIIDNHAALKYYTPEEMMYRLERAGYMIESLSDGSFAGVPFEDGGGYKINFGGDGIFQYHPADHSHHGGEYWKTQMQGIGEWYDRKGKLIKRKVNGKTVAID
jgi:hypothetical protein